MADSTVTDVGKMKVVELRKELKSRGLAHTGDKAELVSRLQSAMAQEDHGDINLDSDLDSDGVLEDDDDKSHEIALDDSAVELALADQPTPKETEDKAKKPLKRKFNKEANGSEIKTSDSKPKKIVLNRNTSITAIQVPTPVTETEEKAEPIDESNKVKITADIDAKTKLELRAKRFGLPVKVSDDDRKEARKMRFNQGSDANTTTTTAKISTNSENLEKLKKRAERFGQNVSKIMSDIEMKERLEKRKAKFGVAK